MAKHKQQSKKRNSRSKKKQGARPFSIKKAPIPVQKQQPQPNRASKTSDKGTKSRRRNKNTPVSWLKRCIGGLLSIFLCVIGYDSLWPKVVIDSSSAVDSGFVSRQFIFANQPIYPVKVLSTLVGALHVSAPTENPKISTAIIGIAFQDNYTNVTIAGKDSVTLRIDRQFDVSLGNIRDHSQIMVRVTYRIPLPFMNIDMKDTALFEAARDDSGKQIWIKKPPGRMANYNPDVVIISTQDRGSY